MAKGVELVEVLRVANGWIVYPSGRYSLSKGRNTPPSEWHVFTDWKDCEMFIFQITEEAHD